MTATPTLKFAFPRGHTSFSVYSGSVDLSAYDWAHIHEQDTKGNSLRVTLFKDRAEAEQKFGDDVRNLYATHGTGDPPEGKKVYKTLTGPTKRFLGFERDKNYLFGRVYVPVHKIDESPSAVTYDIDLTDQTVKALIRNGVRRAASKPQVKQMAKQVPERNNAVVPAKTTTAPQVVSKPVKVNSITLPPGTTIADLKKLNFQVMIVDANDTPFAVETK